MKIIIAGDGKVGQTLTKQLTAEGYDLTLIDANPKVLEASEEMYDIMAVQGNCASMEVLEQAGIEDAELVIAATSADEINLLCCLTAHGMNRNVHTIARIRNPEYSDQIYKMRDTFTLSMTVNPERQAAVEIGRLLKYPGFLKRDTFAKGRVEIVELRVDRDSKLCDQSLSAINSIVGCRILVCTVLREGEAVAPDGNFIIKEKDRLFVTATAENMTTLLKNLGIITHKVKRVMICGGGRVGYYLAKDLRGKGMQVRLIENDYEKCRFLAQVLPGVSIIHGDISDERVLQSEGIESCDAIVTLTGMDELNIITSIYGTNCGVPQVITKLGRNENMLFRQNLPIGSTISPKQLCCNSIVRYVRALKNQTGAALSVHKIADGFAEALEFRVDGTTRHIGEPLKKLNLKKNVLLACITRTGISEIPSGDSYFQEGDTVIIVTSGDTVIYRLNDIFEV